MLYSAKMQRQSLPVWAKFEKLGIFAYIYLVNRTYPHRGTMLLISLADNGEEDTPHWMLNKLHVGLRARHVL